jgi:hypothetical protein
MQKRNDDLEKKALSLMLQNEEKKLKKYMKDNGMEDSDEYESETDSENDEDIMMAIKLSQ